MRALLQAAPRPARTQFTLTEVDAILARIAECRQIGYATNSEELFLGDMGRAASLVDCQGNAVGALHLSPPTSRWTLDEATQKLAPMLIECARAISSTVAF